MADQEELDEAAKAPAESSRQTEKTEFGLIARRSIELEMQESYLDYAMSVIVSRALPDVRDGLKPVHRRILFAMDRMGMRHSARFRKSAAVVGEVLAKYHPHGDAAVYDSLTRMAQDFSMRMVLVDGQGNFGSMDGDQPAAMRYTESRMTALAEEMLADIEKETVNFQPNYDGTQTEPKVLPSKIPQLLLNGSVGIAVGMATSIPPHNLSELLDGLIALIENPALKIEGLLEFIQGPDFPTGGNIYDLEEIKMAYTTGRGKVLIRGQAEIVERKTGGFQILVTEIPYQVNKATLVVRIADLVRDKKIEGISDLRDESDRDGVRVVIELSKTAYPQKVLNRLYELTQLQTVFYVNSLALTKDLQPRVMNLKEMLEHFIEHRKEVVRRRTKFDLARSRERAHILEGLIIALNAIDAVIKTIKEAVSRDEAGKKLVKGFKLTAGQATAILDMRLAQLAALERKKIEDEYQEIQKMIRYLEELLASEPKVMRLIKDELLEIKEKYSDPRKTRVHRQGLKDFSAKDLIPDEPTVLMLTHGNYIKRMPIDTYQAQKRGGKGIIGMTTKEDDQVEHVQVTTTHDDALFFTNLGRVFKTKVYEIPVASRQAKGQALVNIVQLAPTEKVTSIVCLTEKKLNSESFLFMATEFGQVKKTAVSAYANVRKTGIIGLRLKDGDRLLWAKLTSGKDRIFCVSAAGQAILFKEKDTRRMGRGASGVRGMRLRSGDRLVSMAVLSEENSEADLLVVSERGFGKRTRVSLFKDQSRGGIGTRAMKITEKTGQFAFASVVSDDRADLIIISKAGQTIRFALKSVKRLGRDAQGVTLMRLKGSDLVASVTVVLPEEPAGDNSGDRTEPPAGPLADKKKEPFVDSRLKKTDRRAKIGNRPISKKPSDSGKATSKGAKNNHRSADEIFQTRPIKSNSRRGKSDKQKNLGDRSDVNWWGATKKRIV